MKRHIIQIRIRERVKARESEDEREGEYERESQRKRIKGEKQTGEILLSFLLLSMKSLSRGPFPWQFHPLCLGFQCVRAQTLDAERMGFLGSWWTKGKVSPSSPPIRRAAVKGILKRQSVRRVAVCLKLDSIYNCGFYCTLVPISFNYP